MVKSKLKRAVIPDVTGETVEAKHTEKQPSTIVERDFSDFKYEQVVAEHVHNRSRMITSTSSEKSNSFSAHDCSRDYERQAFEIKAQSRFACLFEDCEEETSVSIPFAVSRALAIALSRFGSFKKTAEEHVIGCFNDEEQYSQWCLYLQQRN